MDLGDAGIHAGATLLSGGLLVAVDRLIGARKKEREEDKAAAKDKDFETLKDRVTKLEGATDHFGEQLRQMSDQLKEMRAELRLELEAHRRNVHDAINRLTAALLERKP